MSSENHKTLVTFDIDGTLMLCGNKGATHRDAIKAIMTKFLNINQEPSQYLNVSFSGASDSWIIKLIIEKAYGKNTPKFNEYSHQFIECAEDYFLKNFDGSLDLFPGVVEAVNALANLPNVDIGICSGNLPKIGIKKLEAAGLNQLINSPALGFGLYEERSDILKDAIEKGEKANGCKYKRVIHIGDAPQDVEAAQKCGAIPIAVSTNHHGFQDFPSPCFVIRDLKVDLEDVLNIASNGVPINANLYKK